MKCPFCGTEIDDSAKFCYVCGSSMSDAPVDTESILSGVQNTVDELGVSASDYIDQLNQTSQDISQALQGGKEETKETGSVTDEEYLQALQRAEQTINYGPSSLFEEKPEEPSGPSVTPASAYIVNNISNIIVIYLIRFYFIIFTFIAFQARNKFVIL